MRSILRCAIACCAVVLFAGCAKKAPTAMAPVVGSFPWEVVPVRSGNCWFSDIEFSDADHGWVVGEAPSLSSPSTGVLYRTVNGGANWNIVHDDSGRVYHSCAFFNADTGFVVGGENMGPGIIWKTANGGTTLVQVHSESANSFHKVQFINRMVGWALGESRILKTSDGGASWSLLPTEPELFYPRALFSASENDLYVVGSGWNGLGYLGHTINGGGTWDRLDIGPDTCNIHDITFSGDSTIWIVASTTGHGVLYKSVNGGSTWAEESNETINAFGANTVFFRSSSNGWIGGAALFETTDGGDTWVRGWYSVNMGINIRDFEMASNGLIWACGSALEGVVVKGTLP
ncbi:hypothetical protein EG831_01820 [bacterium]|nr:hypothetical protein [bacterium]